MFVPYKSVIWVCLEMGYTSYKNREIVDKLWDGIFWATLFSDKHIYIWRFPKMGVPLYRWLVYFMENPTEMDDLEVALF